VLVRRKLPPPASAQVYELTPWGYEAEPIFQTLGRWAARSPAHDPTLPLSAVSLFLSFRTMFDASRAEGLSAHVGFRIGAETFLVRIEDGEVQVGRGGIDAADAVISGAAPVVAAAVYGGVPLDQLEAQGALKISGDRALAKRFVTLFVLPPKVGEA
jgi:alkyl sulfatase BDS1-like metallo-beta-lactamase superfamily hydrolase